MRSVPAGGVDGDPDGGAIVVGSPSVRSWGKSDSGAESDAGVGPVPDSVEEDAMGVVVVVSDTTETSSFCDVRGLPPVEFKTKWGRFDGNYVYIRILGGIRFRKEYPGPSLSRVGECAWKTDCVPPAHSPPAVRSRYSGSRWCKTSSRRW